MMEANDSLLVLSEIGVELGAFSGQLPTLIQGHVKFANQNDKELFTNNHEYVLGGVSYNISKGYVCACGEAFLEFASAEQHYSMKLQKDPRVVSCCSENIRTEKEQLRRKGKGIKRVQSSGKPVPLSKSIKCSEKDKQISESSNDVKDEIMKGKPSRVRLIAEGIFEMHPEPMDHRFFKLCAEELGVVQKTIRRYYVECEQRRTAETGNPYKPFFTEEILSQAKKVNVKVMEKIKDDIMSILK